MDDFEHSFADFPFLPGIDLTLWVQIIVTTLVLAIGIAGLAFMLG